MYLPLRTYTNYKPWRALTDPHFYIRVGRLVTLSAWLVPGQAWRPWASYDDVRNAEKEKKWENLRRI